MLDIRFIRDNAERVQQASQQKGYTVDITELLRLDDARRELLASVEALRQQRNQIAASMKGGKPAPELVAEGKRLKEAVADQEDRLRQLDEQFMRLLKEVPNMPAADVPVGSSEDDNVVVKTVGQLPQFDFTPKSHWELAEARGWIDKERAAKVAGARFAYIKGDLALLWQAVVNFGTAVLTSQATLETIINQAGLQVPSKPFELVFPPAVARTEVYEATGRLNKEEQTYKLADDDLWLNASAEHTLCAMYYKEILDEANLPIRYVGYTTAFRREAGTYGKDAEGIFRLHQFDKLEMESFTTAEASLDEHYLMVAIQEYLMTQLGLPYRVLNKCTADIGKPNARGVDIDAWLPSQNTYRETHTADLITDYQTRSLQTRVRRNGGQVELAHTNDATAFSMRPLIAILENYQTADGTVRVPAVLQPYMGGRTVL